MAEALNPVIKLYIDKNNTPITSNFKLNRQSSGTSGYRNVESRNKTLHLRT